jgi:hypothetical protein
MISRAGRRVRRRRHELPAARTLLQTELPECHAGSRQGGARRYTYNVRHPQAEPYERAIGGMRLLDNDLLENEMAKYKLVVLTEPKADREDEYNDWYTNQHLADVVAVPGFLSAQRFKLRDAMGFEHRNRYLAIYEIESDDPQAVMAEMFRRRGTPAMVVSESLDLEKASAGLFETCSAVVKAGAKPRQAAAR